MAAEGRSLYFCELATRYSCKKQSLKDCVFFLSAGAAGCFIARVPVWVPASLSMVVALLFAYMITVDLDVTIRTMATFHCAWGELALGYESLGDGVYGDEDERRFEILLQRERDLSDLTTTDGYNDLERGTPGGHRFSTSVPRSAPEPDSLWAPELSADASANSPQN